MEARALNALVEVVLPRAWRRGSRWHGDEHWRCVATTGLELRTSLEGVDGVLVFCFGLLHDTRRENEHVDPGHGPRAASFAAELRREGALQLDDVRFAALGEALRLHSDGRVSADPTVGACWDADRLHLPRVAIEPDPLRFSTSAAHDPDRLSGAAALRDRGAPSWDALAALAVTLA